MLNMNMHNEKTLTDDILSFLASQSQPASLHDIRKALGCSTELAQQSIDALILSGQVRTNLSGRYCNALTLDIMRGVISATDRGFGFVTTEAGERHFVAPPLMATLVAGDVVDFFVAISSKSGKPAAEILRLISRPETYWLGTVNTTGQGLVFASDEGLNPTVQVAPANIAFEDGDTIQVRIDAGTPAGRTVPATAVLSLGRRGREGFDIDYSIARFRIPSTFSEAALVQAAALAFPGTPEPGRRDIREVGFVTIDGEDSRDFDDALFASETAYGFALRVAIADVSHFVQAGSPLDVDAKERATSVYYPGRTLPMLPEALSNGLCSLNPGVDRYALVAELAVSREGTLIAWEFYPAVIRSHARLTYKTVATVLEGNAHSLDALTVETLRTLERVHKALHAQRERAGLLGFENREPRLVVQNDEIVDIVWRESTVADELVEDCMLAANNAAARFLKSNGGAQLYRHHGAPDGEDWEAARASLARFGIEMPEVATLESMISALESSREKPYFPVVEESLRKSMKPAAYDTTESSHFSLAMPEYTHFTSPIRRYADLMVHRAIKQALANVRSIDEGFADQASHCGAMSRRADQATRMVWTLIKRRHLARLAGQCFEAKALKNAARGLKVVIVEWDCVAFFPATSLEEAGYGWNETTETWHRDGVDIEPGVRVSVRLVMADDSEVLVTSA